MATGDFKWFAQALHDLGEKIHDLSSDSLLMGIITAAATPSVSTAAPHWGGSGTTNFATNQVATGTSYTGPVNVSGATWTLTATGATLDCSDITLVQDAAGFTNGAWGIIYNETDASKRAIGFIELSSGGTLSLVSGAVIISINASGALALVQS